MRYKDAKEHVNESFTIDVKLFSDDQFSLVYPSSDKVPTLVRVVPAFDANGNPMPTRLSDVRGDFSDWVWAEYVVRNVGADKRATLFCNVRDGDRIIQCGNGLTPFEKLSSFVFSNKTRPDCAKLLEETATSFGKIRNPRIMFLLNVVVYQHPKLQPVKGKPLPYKILLLSSANMETLEELLYQKTPDGNYVYPNFVEPDGVAFEMFTRQSEYARLKGIKGSDQKTYVIQITQKSNIQKEALFKLYRKWEDLIVYQQYDEQIATICELYYSFKQLLVDVFGDELPASYSKGRVISAPTTTTSPPPTPSAAGPSDSAYANLPNARDQQPDLLQNPDLSNTNVPSEDVLDYSDIEDVPW